MIPGTMSTSELLGYFTAEKHGAVLIGALGIISAGFAASLWFTHSPFRAMAWPLVIIGAGQLALGAGLLIRTDSQVARLQEGLRSNPQVTVQSELARMTIRYSGMGAWKVLLPDEDIWRVVSFVSHVRALPPSVDAVWKQKRSGGGGGS
jgi:hypothetical protein